jgi:teichuronopeptide biosynthesis TupA-like protein
MEQNPPNRFIRSLVWPIWERIRDALPARQHVILDHLRFLGTLPDLKNPKTFSEKIAYRKLHDRDPRLPPMVDKIAAKELMAARFGEDFIIPTLATFESESEIDFGKLPYPCVLKPNHGSGRNVFLDAPPANEQKLRKELRRFPRMSHHYASEEWAYSMVKPRLLVEPFIAGGEHGLIDYKFHTFSGKVFAIQVDVDRYTNHGRCFFDKDWKLMPFELLYPSAKYPIQPPQLLAQMIRYAEQIGEGFSYIRVDLYEIEGQVKFGEATFYPGAGLEPFRPREYDAIFGAQWV